MRHFKTIAGKFVRNLKTLAHRAPFQRAACLSALVGSVALANFSLGDENEESAKAKSAPSTASQRAATPDPTRPAQSDAAASGDHVRHHGALGVLLSKSDEGVIVVGVIPGSAAARAGLRLGDEIRYVGDQRIHTIPELIDTIGGSKPGARIDLQILRNGRRQIVEANLAARESTFANDDAGPRDGSPARGNPPAARGRAPDAAPAGPAAASARERQFSQRMRALERQIYLLQRELNELKYAHSVHAANSYENMQQWWEREHHGEADDDPALFQ